MDETIPVFKVRTRISVSHVQPRLLVLNCNLGKTVLEELELERLELETSSWKLEV